MRAVSSGSEFGIVMAKTTRKKTSADPTTAKKATRKKPSKAASVGKITSTPRTSVTRDLPQGVPNEMFVRFIQDAGYRKRLLKDPAKTIAKDHPELSSHMCADLVEYIKALDADTAEHVSALARLAIC